MAIQFNCPQCQALIQVPDNAGGKAGKCPQCHQKLLVPKVGTVAVEEAAAPSEPSGFEPPPAAPPPEPQFAAPPEVEPPPVFPSAPAELEQPAFPGPPEPVANPDAPFGGFNPVAPVAPTPMATRMKRRRRSKGAGMTLPLIFGGLLIVGIAGFLWMNQKTLTGSLKGQTVKSKVIAPAYIAPGNAPNVDKDEIRTVRDQLLDFPEFIRSQLMEIEFRGATGGIQMTLKEGPNTKLVRVSLGSDPFLQEYYAEHAKELDVPRQEEFQQAVGEFFEKWKETDGKVDYKEFRDSLALNAFLPGGLGYNVVAAVDGKAFLCVAEGAGELYFLVPKDTTSFVIKPRELKNGSTLLPEEFQYTVNVRG